MKTSVTLSIAFLTLTTHAFADTTITTNSANGNKQTTIIDANGNLKFAEPSSSPASAPTPKAPPALQGNGQPAMDSTNVTSPGMKAASPSSQNTTSSPAPSVPRPPQPLYGTVGSASVLQTPSAAPVPANSGSTMSSGAQNYPPPPPATSGQAIGNAAPMIPSQPRAK